MIDRPGPVCLDPGQSATEPLAPRASAIASSRLEGRSRRPLLSDRSTTHPARRSTASNVAARSVPPCDSVSSSISFLTSTRLCVGSPMTTRGGSPIRITLMAVAPARVLHHLRRDRLGLIEPARFGRRVAHAQRGVQHDDSLGSTTGDHRAERFEERFGHRRDDQDAPKGFAPPGAAIARSGFAADSCEWRP